MAITEAARADLYNGLAEVLGPDRAEALMTQLPDYDPVDIATKDDIAGLRSDISGLGARLDAHGNRLDRLFLTLVAGLFAIIAAMAGVVFVTL